MPGKMEHFGFRLSRTFASTTAELSIEHGFEYLQDGG